MPNTHNLTKKNRKKYSEYRNREKKRRANPPKLTLAIVVVLLTLRALSSVPKRIGLQTASLQMGSPTPYLSIFPYPFVH